MKTREQEEQAEAAWRLEQLLKAPMRPKASAEQAGVATLPLFQTDLEEFTHGELSNAPK